MSVGFIREQDRVARAAYQKQRNDQLQTAMDGLRRRIRTIARRLAEDARESFKKLPTTPMNIGVRSATALINKEEGFDLLVNNTTAQYMLLTELQKREPKTERVEIKSEGGSLRINVTFKSGLK